MQNDSMHGEAHGEAHGKTSHQQSGDRPSGMNPSGGFNLQWIIERAKNVMLNPKSTWVDISNETTTTKSLYMSWVIPMAAFLGICQFLSSWLVGYSMMGMTYKPTFMSSLGMGMTSVVTNLIAVFVAAFILNFLAPKFSGRDGLDRTLRLVAYASTPNYLAGILGFIPGLWIGTVVLGFYSIYIFWIGVQEMTGVPAEKKVPYTAISVVAIFITMIVIGFITTAMTGGGPNPAANDNYQMVPGEKIQLPGGITIDPNEAQKSMEQIQKMFPNQGN